METKSDNIIYDLKLYGEQMSLKSRDTSEKNKTHHRSRPKSALYSTDAMTHIQKRRPLSAGTDPRSTKINSFLRTPKRDEISDSYTSRNTPVIPGSAESSTLLEKLLQDPLKSTTHLNYDDISDISSVENLFDGQTKPKIKSTFEEKAAGLKASAIKLKKYRSPSIEKLLQKSYTPEKSPEKKPKKLPSKLTICVPNIKDENTSSGVSSSSEIHHPQNKFSSPRLSENIENADNFPYRLQHSNKTNFDWFSSDLTNKNYDRGWDFDIDKNKDLTGRVSFGNPKHFDKTLDSGLYNLSPDFNPELSLVEEESSQESDASSSNQVKFRLNNDHKQDTDNTIEKKYKELQEKYKSEERNITKKHSSYFTSLEDLEKRRTDWDFLNRNGTKENSSNYLTQKDNFTYDDARKNLIYDDTSKPYIFDNDQLIPEKLNSVPKIVIEEVATSTPKNRSSIENTKIDDKYLSVNPSSATNIQESNYTGKTYPKYLAENESKSYTSKVLEDYKKEIASIENNHELALKDLRNTYLYNETTINPEENLKENVNTSNESPISKDSIITNESPQAECDNFSDNDRLSKEMSDLSHDIEQNTLRKPRVKRKMKKKEKNVSKETTITSNTTNSLKRDTSRRTNYKTRTLKSAPVKKNIQTSKFKQHKITLSKSTTNINHTSYIDYDNGVESWMASHISSPENSFFTRKRENASNNSSINSDGSKIEKEIKPIINTKRSMSAERNNSANESSMVTSNPSVRDTPKLKEVSFKDDYESDIERDSNDWNQEDNNINGILDNTELVSNIHSVLNEIKTSTPYKYDYDDHTSPEYKDIMDFLENVENSADREISSLSHTQPIFALKIEELMELSKAELAHKTVASALAAGKASETAAKLRAALSDAVKRTGVKLQAAKQSARQKIAASTQQSAVAIGRHQKFIEQLITEKKALSERIEQLVSAATSAETRRARAAAAATERLQLELKNQRQRLSAAHHRDKQAWLKQHTQKIKEMTVKSLETEIKDMELQHSAQISAIRKENDDMLLCEREKYAKEIRAIKEKAAQNLEDALDRERMLAAERLEQKRIEWESALANATERAGIDAREAARKADDSVRMARKEAESWLIQKEKDINKKVAELEKSYEEKKQTLNNELAEMKDRLKDEFESYKDEFVKKQNDNFKIREMELKSMMRRERDREIEKAVDCMEIEAQRNKNEMQENIRRLKDKYENEIQVLEESEKSALQKYKNLHEQLKDMQECYSAQQITITQLEGKIKQSEELRHQAEKQTEIAVKMAENRSKDKFDDLREQMKNLQQLHKDEMHQLYAKVKLAVSKKDNALTAARREASTLRERCVRLESRQN